MSGALPFGDPQFWLVTALVALVALFAGRRIRRSLRSEAETPCASCPKAAAPEAANGARGRLRVVPMLLLAWLPGAASAATVERAVAAMGTTLRVEVEIATDRAAALAAAEAMIRAVEATEAALSTWRDDSELAAINRAPVGEWLPAPSPALGGALAGALRCAEATGGAFDPTVGALVEAWGLRRGGRVPSEREIEAARARVGWPALEWRSRADRIRKTSDVVIEEGGFGKGAALDAALAVAEAAHRAGEIGFARLDIGGQLAWTNATRTTTVELADPRDRHRPVLELVLAPGRGSLSTSGNSERRSAAGVGHLLDPRTGRPAADFGSAAALESSALAADCLSTGYFVLGPAGGAALLERGGGHEAVFLVVEGETLRALVSPGLAARVRALDPRVGIEALGRKIESS